MKKSDLQTGMMVKTVAGEQLLILKDTPDTGDMAIDMKGGWSRLGHWTESLEYTGVISGQRIDKVFKPRAGDYSSTLGSLFAPSKEVDWIEIWSRNKSELVPGQNWREEIESC